MVQRTPELRFQLVELILHTASFSRCDSNAAIALLYDAAEA